jgi:hypothetical protein
MAHFIFFFQSLQFHTRQSLDKSMHESVAVFAGAGMRMTFRERCGYQILDISQPAVA